MGEFVGYKIQEAFESKLHDLLQVHIRAAG
jgi:hypothetical protein